MENPTYKSVPLAALMPSPTNPRKRFSEEHINGIAETMKSVGVLQPLVVREFKGKYEIVAGESRYRAASIAGLKEVPVTIRDLSDAQVIKIQVIENLQRADLHPLEEAEGFKTLLDKSKELDGYNVDSLAAEIGSSRRTIYAKMQLCKLCEKAKAAFYEGKLLTASTALLISRLPGESLQMKALKHIKESHNGSEPPTYRAVQHLLENNFTVNLQKAPFDITDAKLVPKAGTCGDCPKRTGNCPELYPDIKSADVCTDPECYSNKRGAHVIAIKKSGVKVIQDDQAEKIFPYSYSDSCSDAYVKLDDNCWQARKNGTYRSLLGKQVPEILTVENPHNGTIHEVVSKSEANKVLKASGLITTTSGSERDKEREQAAKLERAYRAGMHDALHAHYSKQFDVSQLLKPEEIKLIAERFWNRTDFECNKHIVKTWWPHRATGAMHDECAEFRKLIPIMTTAQHLLLIMDMALISERVYCDTYSFDKYPPEALHGTLKVCGIKLADVKRGVDEQIKAHAEARKQRRGAKAENPKPASTPPSAAPAKEKPAPEKAIEEAKTESRGEISEAEASLLKAAESVVAAAEKPLPPAMQRIKDKALAKKAKSVLMAKKQSGAGTQDVPSRDGDVQLATDATATVETTAQPA